MEIPGLIANNKNDSKLTSAELQAKRDSFEAYMKVEGYKIHPHDYVGKVHTLPPGSTYKKIVGSIQ